MSVTHLSPVQTSAQLRDAAHEALRDSHALHGCLMEACEHSAVVTESDKDVLRRRLRALNESVGKVIR